jgi:hypothetical protein
MNRPSLRRIARTLTFLVAAAALSSCAHVAPVSRAADLGVEAPAPTAARDPEAMRELTWVGGQALPLGMH